MYRNSACISGNCTYIVRRSADDVRVLPRAFSMPSLLPPTTVHPRCVMCGGVFRRGVGEARPKLTCTGGCKEHMWKVLAALRRKPHGGCFANVTQIHRTDTSRTCWPIERHSRPGERLGKQRSELLGDCEP